MHFTIISGSHRSWSQSSKVANYLANNLPLGVEHNIIDLANNPLPLWNDHMWDSSSTEYQETSHIRHPMKEILTKTDALIIIAPERAGMVPAWLKNFFLYCSSQQLANKPALAIGVSAGINGAYPIAELKVSSNKNAQFFYIPQHVILRNIKDILNNSDNIQEREQKTIERVHYSLAMLKEYALAMIEVRKSWVSDIENFPYGM